MDIEKQIKEMAKVIRPILESRTDVAYIPDLDNPIANALLEQGYRKITEDKIVISKEEIDNIKLLLGLQKENIEITFINNTRLRQALIQAQREIARDVLNCVKELYTTPYSRFYEELLIIAEKYGIKEIN